MEEVNARMLREVNKSEAFQRKRVELEYINDELKLENRVRRSVLTNKASFII